MFTFSKINHINMKFFLLAVFIGVTVVLTVPRATLPWAWDDVSLARLDSQVPINFEIIFKWLNEGGPQGPTGPYRPIQFFIIYLELVVLGGENPGPHVFLQSSIVGVTSVLIYLVAIETTHNRKIAIAATFFYPLSKAVIISTWTALSKQPLAELFLVLGILSFLYYIKTNQIKWFVLIAVCSVLGSMTRELAFAIPLIVLITTIVNRKKDWKIFCIMPILIIYGIYPASIPSILTGHELHTPSIFERFHAGSELAKGLTGGRGILYETPYGLLTFLPFIMTILAYVSMFLNTISSRKAIRLSVFTAGGILISLSFISLLARPEFIPNWLQYILPSANMLALVIPYFTKNKMLVIWLIIGILPFFRLGDYNVFLKPASIPWIIITLFWVSQLPQGISKNIPSFGIRRKELVTNTVLAIVMISFVTQAFNIIQFHTAFAEISTKFKEIADYSIENMQTNSMLGINHVGASEILLYVEENIRGTCCGFKDKDDFKQFIQFNSSPDLYYLARGPATTNTIRSVFFEPSDVELVKEYTISCGYPIINPLDALPKYKQVQWIFGGPVDIAIDFEYSNDITYLKCVQRFSLYKYTPTPYLIGKYSGFNIHSYAENYYASHSQSFSQKECIENYDRCYIGISEDSLYKSIDMMEGFSEDNAKTFYQGFSLLQLEEQTYALGRNGKVVISGFSLDQVKQLIKAHLEKTRSSYIPTDNQASFYSVAELGKGTLGSKTLIDDNNIRFEDANSMLLQITQNGTANGFRLYKNFDNPRNWSSFEQICFFYYGHNNNETILFDIFDGIKHGSYFFKDDFEGWKNIPIRFSSLTKKIDLSNIKEYYWDFMESGNHRLDNIRLDNNC